ncbi:12020_t:CDS:2 [Gigaspora margarita]|uniref:12020_t:CDS:1 n=1 Tax=Gigaspora margarita TaxID=4874 RepID=A0ABM8W030_GIGMA|nr:12020_t:CDS:2 [Gigaspora margarita]
MKHSNPKPILRIRKDAVRQVKKAQESAKIRYENNTLLIEEIKKEELVLVYKASQQHSKSHKLHPK